MEREFLTLHVLSSQCFSLRTIFFYGFLKYSDTKTMKTLSSEVKSAGDVTDDVKTHTDGKRDSPGSSWHRRISKTDRSIKKLVHDDAHSLSDYIDFDENDEVRPNFVDSLCAVYRNIGSSPKESY